MAAFRAWYAEFGAAARDHQITEDEAAALLDWLIDEALDDWARVAAPIDEASCKSVVLAS